jgi:hypothetical protein
MQRRYSHTFLGVPSFPFNIKTSHVSNPGNPLGSMKLCFIIGAGLGGVPGLICVIRCIMRKVDP